MISPDVKPDRGGEHRGVRGTSGGRGRINLCGEKKGRIKRLLGGGRQKEGPQ